MFPLPKLNLSSLAVSVSPSGREGPATTLYIFLLDSQFMGTVVNLNFPREVPRLPPILGFLSAG